MSNTASPFPSVEVLLDARQIAERLGVTAAYVYQLAALGHLETVRFGRRCVRFPARSVDALIEARRTGLQDGGSKLESRSDSCALPSSPGSEAELAQE
jgi:excisionase family DNA binding protein